LAGWDYEVRSILGYDSERKEGGSHPSGRKKHQPILRQDGQAVMINDPSVAPSFLGWHTHGSRPYRSVRIGKVGSRGWTMKYASLPALAPTPLKKAGIVAREEWPFSFV